MKSKIQKTIVFLLRSSSSCMSSFLNYLEYIRLPPKRPPRPLYMPDDQRASRVMYLFPASCPHFYFHFPADFFSHTRTELVPLDPGENRVPLSRIQSPFP